MPGSDRQSSSENSTINGLIASQESSRYSNTPDWTRTVAPDIQVALWTKFLFIASFSGVGAMANAPAGVVRSDPKWRTLALEAMEEIYAIGPRSRHQAAGKFSR
jgi:ketopantoate reductase